MIWDIFTRTGEFTGRQVATADGATAQDAWIAAGRPEERMQYVERIQGLTAEQSIAKQQGNWAKAIQETIQVHTYEEAVAALANQTEDGPIVIDPNGDELFEGDNGPMYSDGASASVYGPLSE